MISIRKAEKTDCVAMFGLIKELAVFEKAPDAVTVSLTHFEESGFGNNPVWWAFVAEDSNKQVIGFALCYTRYSTWKGQRMYLEDLLVTEAWRGKGVGKLLFNTLMEDGKKKNFSGITWQVLEWNEPAIQFYKKFDAHLDPEWINGSIELYKN